MNKTHIILIFALLNSCAPSQPNPATNPSASSPGNQTPSSVSTVGQVFFSGFESAPTGEQSGVTLTADRFGKANSAYRFSGEGSYLKVDFDINPSKHPALTLSAWARFTPSDNPQSGIYQVLSHDDGGYDRGLGIDDRSAKGFGWSSFAGSQEVLGAATITQGQWVQLTTVYDQQAKSARFFVNGKLIASSNEAELGQGHSHFYLGANPNFVESFPGDIDDVRIYSRALSDQEVAQLYEGSKP